MASPAGLSFVTTASMPPPFVPCAAPFVGYGDGAIAFVEPTTYALPAASTATPSADSTPGPPCPSPWAPPPR